MDDSRKNQYVYLTGARGYLGGWLRKLLPERGHTFVEDLADADVVIHLHWYSAAGNGQPKIQEFCYQEAATLVDAVARLVHPPRFIFASSVAVYGSHAIPRLESDPPTPNCDYGKAKAKAESYIRSRLIDRVIFRFGSMMGLGLTRTKTELVVNALASAAYTTGKIEVWSPDDHKPVLHVRNAAELLCLGVEHHWGRTVINAACASPKAREIAEIAAKAAGAEIVYQASTRPPKNCELNTDRLMVELARMPSVSFKQVPETVLEFKGFVPSAPDKNTPWEI